MNDTDNQEQNNVNHDDAEANQETQTNEDNNALPDNDAAIDNTADKTDKSNNNEAQENSQEDTESPEWFMKDKYKSVEEQAKSAFELQKKMGKYWGAPQESYSLEELDAIDSEDPVVKGIEPALKEMGVSQDGFKHLVDSYVKATEKMAKQYEEELKKELTTKDAHTYNSINKWMGDNLKENEIEQIKNNWLLTPKDFHMFNQLRLMAAPSTSVPSSSQNDGMRFESSSEVENDKIKYRKEVKSGIRSQDKNYENELAARFRDAKAREMRKNG